MQSLCIRMGLVPCQQILCGIPSWTHESGAQIAVSLTHRTTMAQKNKVSFLISTYTYLDVL